MITNLTSVSTIKLNNGMDMPVFGLGVFKMGDKTCDAVAHALRSGYRLIDTARYYGNEKEVGEGIKKSGIPREDIFITTKVWNERQRNGTQRESVEESLLDLDVDYIDLLLIHWPVKGKYLETWKIFEDLLREGKVKAIGLSNFLEHHIEDILRYADITPVVNQLEIHPRNTRKDLIAYCRKKDIVCEAWSPLGSGTLLKEERIVELSKKYGKSPAQIILRWGLQQNLVVIPKSSDFNRIEQNADLFDFSISEADMELIDAMNENWFNSVTGADPDTFTF